MHLGCEQEVNCHMFRLDDSMNALFLLEMEVSQLIFKLDQFGKFLWTLIFSCNKSSEEYCKAELLKLIRHLKRRYFQCQDLNIALHVYCKCIPNFYCWWGNLGQIFQCSVSKTWQLPKSMLTMLIFTHSKQKYYLCQFLQDPHALFQVLQSYAWQSLFLDLHLSHTNIEFHHLHNNIRR